MTIYIRRARKRNVSRRKNASRKRNGTTKQYTVFADLESYEHGSVITNVSGPVSFAEAAKIVRKLEKAGKYRGRKIFDIYAQEISRTNNPNKSYAKRAKRRGKRIKVGDSVRVRGHYGSGSIGVVARRLKSGVIRAEYGDDGASMAIDGHIRHFRKARRTRNPQKKSFSTGGFVLHKIPITDKTHASAWFDERGNLLDSELYGSRNFRSRGRARGQTIDYLQKLGERYLNARDS